MNGVSVRVAGLVLRRVGAAQAAAHGLAVVLVGIAASAEGRAWDGSFLATVLGGWSLAAGGVALLGGAWATAAARRERVALALACAGATPWAWVVWALAVGACVGGVAAAFATSDAPAELAGGWVRGEAGWWRDGAPWPDVPGGAVGPPRPRWTGQLAPVFGASGAGLGAALGGRAPALLVIAFAVTWIALEALARA